MNEVHVVPTAPGIKRRARKLDGQYDDNVFMALLDEASRSGDAV